MIKSSSSPPFSKEDERLSCSERLNSKRLSSPFVKGE
jgi:hypothetical protein